MLLCLLNFFQHLILVMNTFGRIFKVSVYGESHGSNIGITIDGVPAGIALSPEDFSIEISRRKSGSFATTPRIESDIPMITSGVFNGNTTGTPLNIIFENKNKDSLKYSSELYNKPRPGHTDFVSLHKYFGFADYRGSGHFSGRLTVALVAAGVVARKIFPCSIDTKIVEIGGKQDYQDLINKVVEEGDSLGGVLETVITGVPIGLGEPFFDSVESLISHIIFSIPGAKAIEFGAGFNSSKMLGSEYADSIINSDGITETNNCGGIIGGLTNGNSIIFRTAFHPPVSIRKKLQTFDFEKNTIDEIQTTGSHDSCYVLRVPPVIDACVSIVLADLFLIRQSQILQK